MRAQVEGIEEILRNLNRAIANIKNKSINGLIAASTEVWKETETGSRVVPLDWGNLRHSMYVTTALGVHTGKSPDFQGPKAGELASEHGPIVAAAQAECAKAEIPTLIMGYTANYALWVHERIDPSINWQRPDSGPKWFEMALAAKKGEILKYVGQSVKVALTKNYAKTKTLGERSETIEM